MQPSTSPSFTLNWLDVKHWGLMLFSLVAAVILSFVITLVLPSLSGSWSVVALILTPVLHAMLLYIKNNDQGNAAASMIDALPGKDQQ